MNLENLVAIDVHTHAWKSALQLDDTPSESQQAMGRYFRYQPQHQTVPEMAQMYRKLKMAFVVFTVDGPLEERKITNEEIAELAHKKSDVAIPFASINPHRGAEGVRAAKRLIADYGVQGFKFHPSVQEFFPTTAWLTRCTKQSPRPSCRRFSRPGRPTSARRRAAGAACGSGR